MINCGCELTNGLGSLDDIATHSVRKERKTALPPTRVDVSHGVRVCARRIEFRMSADGHDLKRHDPNRATQRYMRSQRVANTVSLRALNNPGISSMHASIWSRNVLFADVSKEVRVLMLCLDAGQCCSHGSHKFDLEPT